MPTTHVFIVDSNTLKHHLEYGFAGTGAKDYAIDFNGLPDCKLHFSNENLLVSMMADISRVREGDFVLFYLLQDGASGITEGKFYGIFRVGKTPPFIDHYTGNQYLLSSLNKSLTFRVLIEPYEVYPKGVTEWEALDEIKNINSPFQMIWSLIYRKLKGNRGNTMVTLYEQERLFYLIRSKNGRNHLNGGAFSFNKGTQEIEVSQSGATYSGVSNEQIDVLPRLINKYSKWKAFEAHLQAYLVNAFARGTHPGILSILNISLQDINWIGNEVSCGVGMQRIDIMVDYQGSSRKEPVFMAIELKAVEVLPANVRQLQRYVDWLSQYYLPNRFGIIEPVLIARETADKKQSQYLATLTEMEAFSQRNAGLCKPIKFIEYRVDNGSLSFANVALDSVVVS